ncbi:MAG: adenylate/guanylate cyclase domain-containing protein [Rhodospirillales bacterium]|nr:adenylate/guanylate cyclase domain-containing protein [Rhodospirillales bacterium]
MHVLVRGGAHQRIRLVAGLVLFTFATTHFLNTALALVDLEIVYRVDAWRTAITRSWPGTAILVLALLGHVSLGLLKLARRSTLRMPPWELLQIATGIAIPFLLLPHIVNTRGARLIFGVNDTYAYELARLWPDSAWLQSTLLLLVWVHGCVGLHYWLRMLSSYRTIAPLLLALAVFVPVAALAGFSVAGREMQMMISDPAAFQALKQTTHWPSPENAARLAEMRQMTRIVFGILLTLALGSVLLRSLRLRLSRRISIEYAAGPVVRAPIGPTLLEVSRLKRVPHTSVCGGRARCSTCRVRILRGSEFLAPPEAAEATTLASINAPPDTRLACQLRLNSPTAVLRLVRPGQQAARKATGGAEDHGVERPVAVLYFDLREFTRLSENRLPYDVVFLLNRMFEAVGDAIHEEDGWIDRYTGDGLIALFGRDKGAAVGCRQALRAARAIDLALDRVTSDLQSEVGTPLRIGMGLHVGPVVLGRIGHPLSANLTAIGSIVNIASRLESLSKEKGCQLVCSASVVQTAGLSEEGLMAETVAVRGLSVPLQIYVVARARDLPEVPGEPLAAEAMAARL